MKNAKQNSRAHGYWHAAAKRMLAVACIPAGVLSHLALTDIAHGEEPDLRLEWLIVRITAALAAALVVLVLATPEGANRKKQEKAGSPPQP